MSRNIKRPGKFATIPVIEEVIKVDKKVVDKDSVFITKHVTNEQIVVVSDVKHDDVEVQRIPINKVVDELPPPVRHEGEVMIISVMKEEVVVSKRLILVEELHIKRTTSRSRSETPMTLKKESIEIREGRNSPEPGQE